MSEELKRIEVRGYKSDGPGAAWEAFAEAERGKEITRGRGTGATWAEALQAAMTAAGIVG